jgi:hypothetical protein
VRVLAYSLVTLTLGALVMTSGAHTLIREEPAEAWIRAQAVDHLAQG